MSAQVRYGLDLGRAAVKLVRCGKNGVQAAERRVDSSLSGPARQQALVDALREVAAELGVRRRDELHVAVPRAAAIVKRQVLPAVAHDELESMIRLQATKDLPFEPDEVVLAWGLLGGQPDEPGAGGLYRKPGRPSS